MSVTVFDKDVNKNNPKLQAYTEFINLTKRTFVGEQADWDGKDSESQVYHYKGKFDHDTFGGGANSCFFAQFAERGLTKTYEGSSYSMVVCKLDMHGHDVHSDDDMSNQWHTVFNDEANVALHRFAQQFTLDYAVSTDSNFRIWIYSMEDQLVTASTLYIKDQTYCEIYTVDGSGFPDSLLYTSNKITLNKERAGSYNGGWDYFTFPTAVSLSASTQYVFVLREPNQVSGYDFSRYLGRANVAQNNYTGGHVVKQNCFTDVWTDETDYDLLFAIGVEYTSGNITLSLDIGEVPTSALIFYANYVKPTGTTLSFEVQHSDDDITYSGLAPVNVGDYFFNKKRYWKVKISFTSSVDYIHTPYIWEVGFAWGKRAYKFVTSESSLKPNGALPLIDDISSLSTSIDFKDYKSKFNKIRISLIEKAEAINLIKDNYWTNLYCICLMNAGLEKQSLDGWYCYYRGYVTKHMRRPGTISVELSDPTDFMKEKIPPKSPTGAGKVTPIELTDSPRQRRHIVDTIQDLLTKETNKEERIDNLNLDYDSFESVKNDLTNYYCKIGREIVYIDCEANVIDTTANDTKSTITLQNDEWFYLTDADDVLNGLSVEFKGTKHKYYIEDYDQATSKITLSTRLHEDAAQNDEMYIKDYDTRIKEPTELRKIVQNLLSSITGFFTLNSGRLKLIRYDTNATAKDTWTVNDILSEPNTTQDFRKDFINELLILYGWKGQGDDIGNYASGYMQLQATAQNNWNKPVDQDLKLNYVAIPNSIFYGDSIAAALAARIAGLYQNGILRVGVTTKLSKLGREVGDMVNLNIDGILYKDNYGGIVKYFIVGKDVDPSRQEIKWKLITAT